MISANFTRNRGVQRSVRGLYHIRGPICHYSICRILFSCSNYYSSTSTSVITGLTRVSTLPYTWVQFPINSKSIRTSAHRTTFNVYQRIVYAFRCVVMVEFIFPRRPVMCLVRIHARVKINVLISKRYATYIFCRRIRRPYSKGQERLLYSFANRCVGATHTFARCSFGLLGRSFLVLILYLIGNRLQVQRICTWAIRLVVGTLIRIRVCAPVINAISPCTRRSIRTTYIWFFRNGRKLKFCRCATIFTSGVLSSTFSFIRIFTVVRTGTPVRAPFFRTTMICSSPTTRNSIKRRSRFIINNNRCNIRSLSKNSTTQCTLYFRPITCFVKFRRGSSRTSYRILRIPKRNRTSNRPNQNRRYNGKDNIRARNSCRKSSRRCVRRSTRRAFRRDLSTSFCFTPRRRSVGRAISR